MPLRLLLPMLLALAPLAAQAQRLVLDLAPATEPRVVGLTVGLGQLSSLYRESFDGAGVGAVAMVNGAECALPTQVDLLPGAAGEAMVTIAIPAGASAPALLLRGGTAATATGDPLRVSREGDRLSVAGAGYLVVHDPARMGGLPSRIELRPSGKVWDTFRINDRLYDKGVKRGFYLRNDPRPEVELLAAGPLRVVVRVRARYLDDQGRAPESSPQASYTFTYLAGSPVVGIDAELSQSSPFAWSEMHFLELHIGDQSFTRWIGGDPVAEAELTGEKKTHTRPWAALRDGDSLVGLVGPGVTRIYDGRGEYGTYLHGPWETWSDISGRWTKSLFLSGAADSVAALSQAAGKWRPLRNVTGVPDITLRRVAALRAQPLPELVAGRLNWWSATVLAQARRGDYGRADALTQEIEGQLRAVANAGEEGLDVWFGERTGWTALSSHRLGAGFKDGQLVSLYDMAADRELLTSPAPLWSLELRDAAKVVYPFGPEAWAGRPGEGSLTVERRSGAERTVTLRFSGCPVADTVGPAVEVTAIATGPRLRLTLAVDNTSALSLQKIDFPVLPLGALGGEGADDTFFFARGAGELQPDPAGRGARWDAPYPGGWSTMQYEAVYDPQGGVYLAAEDPVASTKSIYARGPDSAGLVRYGIGWPAPDMSRPGNDWTSSGEAAIELFSGDWYDAALIYRAWAERAAAWWPARANEKKTPRWFTEQAVWALASGNPYEPEQVVPRTLKFAEAMGVPTAVHWYNWHVIPFDNDYPHYSPTKPRVAEGVAELKAAGVKVMPYINGRLWDANLEDFKTTAKAFATSDEQGNPYLETYSSKEADGSKVQLAAMCPATSFWQDKQKEIVLWLQNEVGVDGVYMDQIGAATPRICMDPSHGHPLGGGHWWTTEGYWPMLRKIRAAMGPDKFLTTECNAEPYAHLMDGYLTWHWQYQNQVPAFSAVYADQVVLFSRAYRGGATQDLANRMKAGQSLCFGEQIGWVGPDVINRPSGAFIAACAKMRWEMRAYLAGGRMLRVPRLEGTIPTVTADWQWSGEWPITLPAIQAGAWQAPDGRAVVILANVSDQPVTVRYPFDPRRLGFRQDRVKVTRRTGTQIEPGTWWKAGDAPELTIPAEQIVALELDF